MIFFFFCFRYFLRSTTVLPYGTFLKRWDFSRCVFAFLSGILFPCIPYFQLEYPFLFYVGVMLDISALIDMCVQPAVTFLNFVLLCFCANVFLNLRRIFSAKYFFFSAKKLIIFLSQIFPFSRMLLQRSKSACFASAVDL